ncbi:MAG: FtsQ-type POTRA domain-containing protein [Ignavibacteriales bacterium]|nr:FtsQ-type POTRA domain-containing protein [Ignavibacteriales bacterium]
MSEDPKISDDRKDAPLRGKSVYWILSGLLLLLVVSWYGSMRWKEQLTVPQVLVDGQLILSQDEILALANIPSGAKMYSVDLASVVQSVESNKFVKRAIVRRNPPLAIHVTVMERVPVAYVASEQPTDLLMVDDESCLLPHAPGRMIFDIPVISGIAPSVSDSLGICVKNASLATALELLRLSRRTAGDVPQQISEVDMRNSADIILYTVDGGIAIHVGNDVLAEKIVKLDGFWKTVVAHEGMQHIKAIDLRFRDQVIVVRGQDLSQSEKKG